MTFQWPPRILPFLPSPGTPGEGREGAAFPPSPFGRGQGEGELRAPLISSSTPCGAGFQACTPHVAQPPPAVIDRRSMNCGAAFPTCTSLSGIAILAIGGQKSWCWWGIHSCLPRVREWGCTHPPERTRLNRKSAIANRKSLSPTTPPNPARKSSQGDTISPSFTIHQREEENDNPHPLRRPRHLRTSRFWRFHRLRAGCSRTHRPCG